MRPPVQRDFETAHQVADDPLEVVRAFSEAGARYVHMVDLDGARSGERKNEMIIRAVAERSGLRVELGGGIRGMRDIEMLDAMGVWRFVIGSAAVSDPGFVAEAVRRYGERIAVGVDAKDGYVRVSGWTEDSGFHYLSFAASMEDLGVKTLIFIDIETDGTLSGPPLSRLRALREKLSCRLIASGGVGKLSDVRAVREAGMDGLIIGKAYYANTIDLKEALAVAGEQEE
jgi:phosphoribosylformimino-5-aminoimidazole carboxamide ribotide isomerase